MPFLACGPTAFQYYRIPPQILGLYPAILPPDHDHRLVHYSKQPVFKDLLGTPVWRFVSERKQRANGKLFCSRLLTQEPPPGSFRQTEHGFDVTSPEFTLLNLATQVSRNQLLMACYEMCSSFAVFTPCKRAQRQLDEAISLKLIPPNCGWERVVDTKGNDTNLWKRAPLLSAGRSPRSPRRPQACVASSNSAGPPNAWQGRPSRPSKSRRPCSSRFPATRAAWASTSPITCASRSVKPRVHCMTKPAATPISSYRAVPTAWASSLNAKPLRPRQRSRESLRCRAHHRAHKHGLRRHPNYLWPD